jgi:protein-S-isoprenylcysteine O-methyltransferase Ste14
MGLIAPPPGASLPRKARGGAILAALVLALLAVGFAVAELILLPFGGGSMIGAIGLGVLVVIVALVVLGFVGRRRQDAAQAKARAARSGG